MPRPLLKLNAPRPAAAAQLFEDWFDPIETALRERVHGVIQAMIEAERDEVTADDNDMIHAASAVDIEKKRKAFVRKWRLRCAAVADCLEEAGDRLFAFTWALFASGQISMRNIDGWKTVAVKPADLPIDLAA